MARGLQGQPLGVVALFALPLLPAALGAQPPSALVRYSFDDDQVEPGPDTFAIFRGANGSVSLSSAYHLSGYRSVEIRDVSGDGDFPELQGYFALRRTGRLFAHFAFLATDPREELNIALAGPQFFQVKKDGIAFWLGTREGMLVHTTDSIRKRLVPVQAFVWYVVDVAYDIDAGAYDLTIWQEGQEQPVLVLEKQNNAAAQPGSAVDKFSFVGDPFGDRSNVTYYVDDVVIATDRTLRQRPFVAPGRRKLFVDLYAEYARRHRQRPRCLPATGPEDFGLTLRQMGALKRDGLLEALERLLSFAGPEASDTRLQAVQDWSEGCAALEAGRLERAVERFSAASARAPQGRIYELSLVVALAGQKRFQEADERLLAIEGAWRGDVRYAVASAIVGTARGDLDRAEQWLRQPAQSVLARHGSPLLRQLWSGEVDRGLLASLQEAFPAAWREHLEQRLVSDQYYYVLLWDGRYDLARDFALRMAERFRTMDLPAHEWLERAGDAAFYARALPEARAVYEEAASTAPEPASLYLKLSDIAFLMGDFATEKTLRERYYGTLEAR